MIAEVREFSPFAGRTDRVLCPPEENRHLGDVERTHAVLEHLWNTTVVHGWGSLVSFRLYRPDAARMNPLGW